MDKLNCYVVKDLLPLYIDDALSEETSRDMHLHLEDCESCHAEYAALTQDLELPSNPEVQTENSRMLKMFKWKWVLTQISILITFVAVVALIFFLFVLGRELLFDKSGGILAPTITRACQWNLTEEDGWTRLTFQEDARWYHIMKTRSMEPYLEFDSLFQDKEIVNSADSSASVEMRILDTDGNVVIKPFFIEAGAGVVLPQLEKDTPYIVEIRGEGQFFAINFS